MGPPSKSCSKCPLILLSRKQHVAPSPQKKTVDTIHARWQPYASIQLSSMRAPLLRLTAYCGSCHRREGTRLLSRLQQVSVDLGDEGNRRLRAPSRQDRQDALQLTSLGQETQLGVLGTPRTSLNTRGTTNDHKRTASYG